MLPIFKFICYVILVGGLTLLCFGKDSKLLFKKSSQLNLKKKHERIANILHGAIMIFICYTILTFGAQQGYYYKTSAGIQFTTLLYKNNFLGMLKEFNDLINAVFTTFILIFTYIVYLLPKVYSTDNN